MSDDRKKLLFVCSMNRWRSPTAENVFRQRQDWFVRSAGTSRSARHTVTHEDIRWADIVLAMEDKHAQRLRADYPNLLKFKEVHVLHIPDEYRMMDPALVALLESSVEHVMRD